MKITLDPAPRPQAPHQRPQGGRLRDRGGSAAPDLQRIILSLEAELDEYGCGRWSFLLESADGAPSFFAEDWEDAADLARLQALALVRGLEALDRPSRVVLLNPPENLERGLTYGLPAWRFHDFQEDFDGELVPAPNADLWRRIDRALRFHKISARRLAARFWRRDESHPAAASERPYTLPMRAAQAG